MFLSTASSQTDMYDAVLANTSIYLLIPAMKSTSRPLLSATFVLSTIASYRHWRDHADRVWHILDCVLASVLYVWHCHHILRVAFSWYGLAWGATCILLFLCTKGLQRNTLQQALVHSAFRFSGFWFVMSVHHDGGGASVPLLLSSLYWSHVVTEVWVRRGSTCTRSVT